MKVTIIDNEVMVEDGPAPDPTLPEDDGRAIAMLQALTWAMARLAEASNQIFAAHQTEAVAAEQANQVLGRLRAGLH